MVRTTSMSQHPLELLLATSAVQHFIRLQELVTKTNIVEFQE